MSALYLYALLDAAPAPAEPEASAGGLGAGLAGEPLSILSAAGLAVAAGEMASAPAPSAAALAAHDAVVRRLAARAPAVLPFRFGQTVGGPEALAAALSPRAAELRDALSRVAGCVQMTLRVFGDPREPDRSASAAPAAGPGTRYLEARREAERAPLRLPGIAELRAALLPLVREERLERHGPGRLLLSAHDLVPAAAAAEYRATVEAARARMASRRPAGSSAEVSAAVDVSVSGPWPPYAFGEAALPPLSPPAGGR